MKLWEIHLDDLNMPCTFMVAFGANSKRENNRVLGSIQTKLWWPEVQSIRRGLSKWWFITAHPVLSSHQPDSTSHPPLLGATVRHGREWWLLRKRFLIRVRRGSPGVNPGVVEMAGNRIVQTPITQKRRAALTCRSTLWRNYSAKGPLS